MKFLSVSKSSCLASLIFPELGSILNASLGSWSSIAYTRLGFCCWFFSEDLGWWFWAVFGLIWCTVWPNLAFSATSISTGSCANWGRSLWEISVRSKIIDACNGAEAPLTLSINASVSYVACKENVIVYYLTNTGKSFSEALILTSVNPQYDERFSIELQE